MADDQFTEHTDSPEPDETDFPFDLTPAEVRNPFEAITDTDEPDVEPEPEELTCTGDDSYEPEDSDLKEWVADQYRLKERGCPVRRAGLIAAVLVLIASVVTAVIVTRNE